MQGCRIHNLQYTGRQVLHIFRIYTVKVIRIRKKKKRRKTCVVSDLRVPAPSGLLLPTAVDREMWLWSVIEMQNTHTKFHENWSDGVKVELGETNKKDHQQIVFSEREVL
jgi:hypothetical protein